MSALNRHRRGDAALYDADDYLLLGVLNTLRGMSWQLGGDSKAARPDTILAPGERDPNRSRGDAMTIDELRKRLGWDEEGR